MSELVSDCPRCDSSRMTFDLVSQTVIKVNGWQNIYEAFCICRHCNKSTVFVLHERGIEESRHIRQSGLNKVSSAINDFVDIRGYISLKDARDIEPPEYLPEKLGTVFSEGTTCFSVGCFNAAGTMFRLCVDLATKALLPEDDRDGLNSKIRRNLGLRLPWLFAHGLLPIALQDLSSCIKEDGNDGAHDGSLKKEEAEDLLDFTFALLERMYTEPERLRLAKMRRDARRGA